MASGTRQQQLRDEFVDLRGYWSESLETLLEADEAFFEAYLRFAAVPWRDGHLEPKVKELVLVAVDAAATHLDGEGLRRHIRNALAEGATREEVLEVLELTSTLGIHASTVGVPLLLEALDGAGRRAPQPLGEHEARLKAEFEARRGYWNAFWDGLLELDADFFEAYLDFSSLPWTRGVLEPKVKELIYTAFDASATHMYVPGLRQHIENAIGYGATAGEIMEVFELASTLGIKACTLGVPILLEELERAAGAARTGEGG
jgi:alkylhydroperoxidase/carboxymuconolactone decarboxylase family protein YurZ